MVPVDVVFYIECRENISAAEFRLPFYGGIVPVLHCLFRIFVSYSEAEHERLYRIVFHICKTCNHILLRIIVVLWLQVSAYRYIARFQCSVSKEVRIENIIDYRVDICKIVVESDG